MATQTLNMSYGDWAAYHCKIFGLTDPRQLEAVRAWVAIFRAGSFLADELQRASDAVLLEGSGFWTEHPARIIAWLNRQRALSARADDDTSNSAVCVDCGGTGRLVVPNPNHVVRGAWRPFNAGPGATFYTVGVRCRCERGRAGRFAAPVPGSHKKLNLLSIDEYERQHMPREDPQRWKKMLAAQARITRELADAAGPAASILDPILERLRQRQRQPGEDTTER